MKEKKFMKKVSAVIRNDSYAAQTSSGGAMLRKERKINWSSYVGAIIIFAIMIMLPQKVFAADAGSRDDAVKWAYEQEGKFLDYDGAYGAQCVDLIKYYYAYFNKASYAKGNGCDYVNNELPEGWTRIKNTADFVPEPGDIAVWGTELSSYGHVAIILSANGSSFVSMDQNWPKGSACKQVTHTYNKFWGVIRPNFKKNTQPITTAPSIWKNRDNYVVGDSVKFSWNSVENATGYWLTVWYKGEQIVTTQVSGSSEYTLENLGEGEYTAFLKAYNEINNMESSISLKVNYITGENTVANGKYQICSALDNASVVSVASASKADEANVLLYANEYHANQVFDFEYLGDGYYKISAVHSGKSLDVYNGEKKSGTNVQQYSWKNSDNQKWVVKDAGDGYFYIISKSNSLYLDVYGGEVYNDANIDTYSGHGGISEKWKLIPYGEAAVSDGKYQICSALDNSSVISVALASDKDEANILLYANEYHKNQIFDFEYLGNGYYKISAEHSNKSLDVYNGESKNGTNVQQYSWKNSDNQKWVVRDAGDGYFYIISKATGLYLDVYGGEAYNDANIATYWGHGGISEKWRLIPAKKEISECSVQLAEDKFVYDGKEKTPDVVVKDGNTVLIKDTDYTTTYKNNLNAGKATVTITGTGKYTGETTKEFEIAKATQELKVSPAEINISVGESVQIEATGQGQISYKSDAEEKAIVSNTGKVTGKQAGKATITITAAGNENYNSASKTLTVNVKAENVVKEGWKKDSKGWWYQNKDGSYPKSQWKKIGTKWYHFDKNGYMETGWLLVNGSWYYLNSDGTMQTDWLLEKGIWYHLNSDGKMETGLVTVGNAKYYLNKSGKMQTGWQNLSGSWYYFKADGKMAVNGWQEVGGKWYYLDQNGAMQKSKWISGIYYVKADGSMAVSEWVDQDRYYVDANGVWVKGKTKES